MFLQGSKNSLYKLGKFSLREKCPNTEFFLVRIRRDTYLSVFRPNVVKYGPEKTPYLDTFHAVFSWRGVYR